MTHHKDYRTGGLFAKSKMSKTDLDKYFPDRKKKARRAAYKKKAKSLLSEMRYS